MPHIIVKMYPDRSAADKRSLADNLSLLLHETMGYKVENISVAVVEVEPSDWMPLVYEADMLKNRDTLVRLPGYGPLASTEARS